VRLDLLDPGVGEAEVDDEHAVDPVLGPPATVDRHLGVDVVDNLDRESDGPRGELRLDTTHELHEERLEGKRVHSTGEHEPACAGPCGRQCPGSAVGVPAELLGDLENSLARRLRDSGAAVQRVRHGPFRDPCAERYVSNRRPPTRVRLLRHGLPSIGRRG
jgi:hypothetical protein